MSRSSEKYTVPVLSHRKKYGYDFIDIEGKVSFDHTWLVEDFINANISADSQGVILNLAMVPFIVSSFLAILLKVKEQLNHRKIDLMLMNPSGGVMDILIKVNAHRFFSIIPSEDVIKKRLDQEQLDQVLDSDE